MRKLPEKPFKRKKGLKLVKFKEDPERCGMVTGIESMIDHMLKNPAVSESTRIMAIQKLGQYKREYSSTISTPQQEVIRLLEEALEKRDNKKLDGLLHKLTCYLKGEYHYE